jgi:hypothetical protein
LGSLDRLNNLLELRKVSVADEFMPCAISCPAKKPIQLDAIRKTHNFLCVRRQLSPSLVFVANMKSALAIAVSKTALILPIVCRRLLHRIGALHFHRDS